MGSAERFSKINKGMLELHPSFVLEDRNKMTKWIAKLFDNKTRHADIVRFIRTEYGKETGHLTDDDCIHYYYHITHKGDN